MKLVKQKLEAHIILDRCYIWADRRDRCFDSSVGRIQPVLIRRSGMGFDLLTYCVRRMGYRLDAWTFM